MFKFLVIGVVTGKDLFQQEISESEIACDLKGDNGSYDPVKCTVEDMDFGVNELVDDYIKAFKQGKELIDIVEDEKNSDVKPVKKELPIIFDESYETRPIKKANKMLEKLPVDEINIEDISFSLPFVPIVKEAPAP